MIDSKQKIDPTILVIFGATGELSRDRLLPALHRLFDRGLLPKLFWIVGFARSEYSDEQFRKIIKQPDASKSWGDFSKKIFYVPGNFANPRDFKRLAEFLHKMESREHSCANRLFYFSTLPSHFSTISHALKNSGLLVGCGMHKRQTRVVVEKPFGHDRKSAKTLDQTLRKYFSESQIYRIDHYLGKETVQNLLTVRFANSIFEPIWNHEYIDHVQISAVEGIGVGNRGAFYEQAGALRDFIQNHLIQMLALTAMERPVDLSTKAIRDERAKVIQAIRLPAPREIKSSLATGQYQGYRKEPHVSPRSKIETYVALKLFLDNPRWVGVPFYLRTGKKLDVSHKTTEISVHFKRPLQTLFNQKEIQSNILTFTVQPKEGIYLHITAKYPGFGIRLHPVTMELGYHSAFHGEIPEAYERLLLDFMEGDQRLFTRADEIELSWRYIDVLEKYIARKKLKPQIYVPDSSGPKNAELLIKKDNGTWHLTQSE